MNEENKTNCLPEKNSQPAHQSPAFVSNITGGITDEEFASEFLANQATSNPKGAKFQFNFVGAELEKINSAKNIRDELKKHP